MSSQGSGTINAVGQSVRITLPAASSQASIDLQGTWSGTLIVQVSLDGINWTELAGALITSINANSTGQITSGATGTFLASGAGAFLEVYASAWVSGSVVATLASSTGGGGGAAAVEGSFVALDGSNTGTTSGQTITLQGGQFTGTNTVDPATLIHADGSVTPTANQPLGGFIATGSGNAVQPTDVPNLGQVQALLPPTTGPLPTGSGNYVTSGGDVIPVTGTLTAIVSQGTGVVQGQNITWPQTTVTFSAADPTNTRIDTVALSNGAVTVITGTPAAAAVPPPVNPITQLQAPNGNVTVVANQTTFTPTLEVVYDEGSEWTGTYGSGWANITATPPTPYSGTHQIKATTPSSATNVKFVRGSGSIDPTSFAGLQFFMNTEGVKWGSGFYLLFAIYVGTTRVGVNVTFRDGAGGFNSAQTGWQQVFISSTLFQIAPGYAVNEITITAERSSGVSPTWWMDLIQWVATAGTTSGGGSPAQAIPQPDFATIDYNSNGALEVKAAGVGPSQLKATAVTPSTYGDGTHVGQFTVDQQGRITGASAVTITGAAPTGSAGGDLTGTYPNPTIKASVGLSGLPTCPDPTGDTGIVNLETLIQYASGTTPDSVTAYSTVNLSGTYANGAAGVGATLIVLADVTLDGHLMVLGDTCILNGQTSTFQNGNYKVTARVAGVSTTLTRGVRWDEPREFPGGPTTILQGTANATSVTGKVAVVTTSPTVIGTDPIAYSLISISAVQSVFGRTGAVVAAIGDYNAILPDGVTLDHSGSGGTMEVAAGGVGTTQLASGAVTPAKLSTAAATVDLIFSMGAWDGATAITANTTLQGPPIVVDFACTILSVELDGQTTGSVVLDLWKCTYAQWDGGATHPAAGDSICASDLPTISSGTKYTDSTLTGWTTSINAGDRICPHLNSISGLTGLTCVLKVKRT